MNDPGLVERCFLYPGLCIDGSQPTRGEGVFDTQVDLPGEHHLYLSRRMSIVAGRAFGMVEQADVADAQQTVVKQAARIAVLEGQLAELRPIADAIGRFADREGVEV